MIHFTSDAMDALRFAYASMHIMDVADRIERAKPIDLVVQARPPPYAERVEQILALNGSPS